MFHFPWYRFYYANWGVSFEEEVHAFLRYLTILSLRTFHRRLVSFSFWAAHLVSPTWGPFASWCCAWLEAIEASFGIDTLVDSVFCLLLVLFHVALLLRSIYPIWWVTWSHEWFRKVYAGSQTLQSIILSCIGTNKDGGYLAPKWLFLCMYMGLTFIRVVPEHIRTWSNYLRWNNLNVVAGILRNSSIFYQKLNVLIVHVDQTKWPMILFQLLIETLFPFHLVHWRNCWRNCHSYNASACSTDYTVCILYSAILK